MQKFEFHIILSHGTKWSSSFCFFQPLKNMKTILGSPGAQKHAVAWIWPGVPVCLRLDLREQKPALGPQAGTNPPASRGAQPGRGPLGHQQPVPQAERSDVVHDGQESWGPGRASGWGPWGEQACVWAAGGPRLLSTPAGESCLPLLPLADSAPSPTPQLALLPTSGSRGMMSTVLEGHMDNRP